MPNCKILKFEDKKFLSSDEILLQSKDILKDVLIMGWDNENNFYSNTNMKNRDALWLIETAKLILFEKAYDK